MLSLSDRGLIRTGGDRKRQRLERAITLTNLIACGPYLYNGKTRTLYPNITHMAVASSTNISISSLKPDQLICARSRRNYEDNFPPKVLHVCFIHVDHIK